MLTILLKRKTKGWHLWLTFCPWLYVLTVGEAETQCLVSAVISESVVGKREKNAHTLLLSHIHMLRSFHHLDKTTLEHLLFSSIALSPSYYCLTQIDVRHCVAIKSWSVFLTHPAEKIEWLIKKSIINFLWQLNAPICFDVGFKKPSFSKKEFAHCWLRANIISIFAWQRQDWLIPGEIEILSAAPLCVVADLCNVAVA